MARPFVNTCPFWTTCADASSAKESHSTPTATAVGRRTGICMLNVDQLWVHENSETIVLGKRVK